MAATAEMPRELPSDEPDDVLFNQLYGVRSIELNRPKKLNSLNGSMVRKIAPRLKVCKQPGGRSLKYDTYVFAETFGCDLGMGKV